MKRMLVFLLILAWLGVGQILFAELGFATEPGLAAEPKLETLLRKFNEDSGAELVFYRDDLPEGRYHDVLKPLSEKRKAIAAAICIEET